MSRRARAARRGAGVVVLLAVSAWLGADVAAAQERTPEATSLLGRSLFPPEPLPGRATLERDLAIAESVNDPTTAEAMITRGRRQAYLWRYRDAIQTFTDGIARYPDDARFYRHRGHRYITTRQFAKAEADLEKAAALVAGRPDDVEPDGQPNPAGVPRSTLQFNIWYHLGLARFLQGDYDGALDAYTRCLAVSKNDDALVATADWMWMTLKRLGRDAEAARILERIRPTMEILENASYHRRLLMYKGEVAPDALLDPANADPTTIATQGFGVANYYLVTGQPARARTLLQRIVEGEGWNAFGYIAAEADLAR